MLLSLFTDIPQLVRLIEQIVFRIGIRQADSIEALTWQKGCSRLIVTLSEHYNSQIYYLRVAL